MENKSGKVFITVLFLAFALIFFNDNNFSSKGKILSSDVSNDYEKSIEQKDFGVEVYFMDVGQADSILIKNEDKYMLIDAGNNEDGLLLVDYLKSLNVKKFDYVFGTHAHEDHIGGMDDIINNFAIDYFYMPDVITTTKTFEDVLDALESKNIYFDTPKIGDKINFGDAIIDVLYVGESEDDLNSSSIVLKLTYGNVSFLFTGDATSEVEKALLNSDIASDVLKVAHHGSKYSTTLNFLKKVNPSYAVISVGKNNSYNHPGKEIIERLSNLGIKIYRTDELSTIIFKTDGNNIYIENIKTNTNGN